MLDVGRTSRSRRAAAALGAAVALAAVGLTLTLGASSSRATVIWNSGFENQSWAPWQSLQHDETVPQSTTFNFVTSPVRTGTYAAQFIAKQGYGPSWGLEGTELCCGPPNEGAPGTDAWWAWSDLFPSSWSEPYHWGIVFQLHAGDDMTPPIAFDAGADALWVVVRTGEASPSTMSTSYHSSTKVLSTLSKGQWHDWVLHVHWSGGSDGVLEVWHRLAGGSFAKALTLTGIPTLQTRGGKPDGIYTNMGIYRDSYCAKPVSHGCTAQPGSPSAHQPDSVIYDDNVVRGSSYDEVVNAAWGSAAPAPRAKAVAPAPKAAAPVSPHRAVRTRATPKLGNASTGNAVDPGGANYLDTSGPYTLGRRAIVTKLTGRIAGERATMSVRGVIYADAGGKPGRHVATTSQVTITAGRPAGWVDLPFRSTVALAPGRYWLGYWYGPGAGSGAGGFHFSPAAGSERYARATYASSATPPRAFPGAASSSSRLALYATYRAAR